jgi:DNA-binding NarL/FixJ family response regulator
MPTSERRPVPKDQRLRILIAEDHPVVRKQVRMVLECYPQFEVIAEAQDGAEAIEYAMRLKPDVVVLNLNMPILNGIDAAREVKARIPDSAIVILSSHADKHFVNLAKQHGACVYISKSNAGDGLAKAVEAAVLGEEFVLVD